MHVYEYISTAIILVAILLAATFLTSISPHLYRSISETEQLKMAAQKVMVQTLLSPGNPENWGEDINVRASDLLSFGLAVSTTFTREAFVLDPDKVQRLNKDLPGDLYIPPDKVLELLGLGVKGRLDYGVRMDFIPSLRVLMTIKDSQVLIVVVSEHGLPVVGANVTLGAFYVKGGRVFISENRCTTDLNGRCIVNLSDATPRFLVAIANYYGLQVMNFTNINSRTGFLLGNNIIVAPNLEIDGRSVMQVFIAYSSEGLRLKSVKCNISYRTTIANHNVYSVSHIEQNVVLVAALTLNGELVIAYRAIPESYASTPEETYAPLVYMLERSVKIGSFTYTVRLKIWRTIW